MRQPSLEQPPSLERKQGELITQVREYQLITPLFGGGVTPGEADPVTVVRGTEIRGHLRFWWRATQGGRFNSSVQAMKTAEDALWGTTNGGKDNKPLPSSVKVQIELLDSGRPFVVRNRRGQQVDVSHWSSDYSYGAFPLESGQTIREGIRFELTLTFPKEYKEEIAACLWAWDTFGGIGARTRRGFGALQCISINDQKVDAPLCSQVDRYIQSGLDSYITADNFPNDLPNLKKDIRYRLVEPENTPLAAWSRLLHALKQFRQTRNQGTQRSRPGRSQWPEPDAIRYFVGRSARQHSTRVSNINKFPRAAFGLPIVFHFVNANQGDPDTVTLQGRQLQKERLASPLILRPLACANEKAVGIALILDAPIEPPSGLVLKDERSNHFVQQRLSPKEAKNIRPLDGQLDVLEAFLDSL